MLVLVCVLCGGVGWLAYTQSADPSDSPSGTASSASSASSPSPPVVGEHTVVYRVTGTGTSAITWSKVGEGSGVDQQTVTLPWSVELGTDRDTIGLTVIAVARGDGAKLEECTISVDGRQLNAAAASGTQRSVACFVFFAA